jgi:hypothetical protein
MKLNKITAILVISSSMIYESTAVYASIPASATPVLGSAVVDGDYSEWNLATDFTAEMREAGKANKDLLSKLYLRYDCNMQTMYVLVLAEDGYEAVNSANDAWIKFDSLPGNGKVVDGNDDNDGTLPDFAWVSVGATFIGYEASFTIAPGTYTEDVEVHIQIEPGRTSSTGKGGQGGTMENLTLIVPADCPADGDGDGVPDDTDNCPADFNPDQINTDFDMSGGDTRGDACDEDVDADGLFDIEDNCQLMPNPDQMDTDDDGQGDVCDNDSDGDGINNATDNCPLMPNSDQTNTDENLIDGDAMGNVCDDDDDADGILDIEDNCQFTPNPDQTDTNDNGQGDACNNDDDGDGINDATDNCPLMPNPDQTNTDENLIDGDAMGDACDEDDDADGVFDIEDNCQLTPNPDQTDRDGDGIGRACDPVEPSVDVDLTAFTATATANGTTVEWITGHEEDIIAFKLYRGIPKVGTGCTSNNPSDYDGLTEIDIVNSGQSIYEKDDNFTASAKTTYCYGLVSINDKGHIVDVLGAKPRQ